MKGFNFYFETINEFYAQKCAERSGVPYMAHIMEGLNVLEAIGATDEAKYAYMLHPIFQSNEAIKDLSKYAHIADPYVLALCMEYRRVANAYLSKRKIESLTEIELSPLKEVNDMLIADKVQNYKDFQLYQQNHPRYEELECYFENWIERLQVDFNHLKHFCFNVAVTCIIFNVRRNEYLLLNRYSFDKTMSGKCNVGGKSNSGEKLIDALNRELFEELGIGINVQELDGELLYYDSFYAQTKHGSKAVLTYYITTTNDLKISLNTNELESYSWVDPNEFLEFWFNDVTVDEEKDMFIAVDFDDTIVKNVYPNIGDPLPYALDTLRELIRNGHRIILWTMRSGYNLTEAVKFLEKNGIKIYSANCHKTQWKWTSSPKVYADYFIDDRNIGTKLINGAVDWLYIREQLKEKKLL